MNKLNHFKGVGKMWDSIGYRSLLSYDGMVWDLAVRSHTNDRTSMRWLFLECASVAILGVEYSFRVDNPRERV